MIMVSCCIAIRFQAVVRSCIVQGSGVGSSLRVGPMTRERRESGVVSPAGSKAEKMGALLLYVTKRKAHYVFESCMFL